MNNILFIVIIFLSICAGLYTILITYQLHKKYRLNYLSTYLYYLIFINVFGIYGILGQVIAKKILQQQGALPQTIETIGHFFSFLGIPFLILAWYMFVRLCREIIEKKLSRVFNLSYFFVLTIVYMAYGTFIVLFNLSNFKREQFAFFSSIVISLYVIFEILVLIIAVSQIFIHFKNIKDEKKQRAVRDFAYLNLFVFCVSTILFIYSRQSSTLLTIYLFIFFLRNIPPVLYWKAYLKRYFVAPALQEIGVPAMRKFSQEYNISKREEEVIQHVCEGKTNKEISNTLFISIQTVKDHIYSIYQKTGVKNRVQLINLIQSYKSEEKNMLNDN